MLSNIQILRAFAAINVAVFHIIGASLHYNIPSTMFMFMKDWGQNGVDIFFVISGFIMVYIQEKKHRKFLPFIKDRVERIVPIYWFLTIFFYGLYLFVPGAFMGTKLTLIEFLTSLLFISNWFGFSYPVVMVGWTLELEMLFYIIFAFCLLIKNKFISYFSMIVVVCLLVLFSHMNLIMLEFVLGMLCGYIYLNIKKKNGMLVFIIGLLLLFVTLIIKTEIDRFFVWGIPSFFIVLGLLWMKQYRNKLLEYLGNASYSIYLIQIFSIPVFYKIVVKYLYFLNGNIVAVLALLFTVLVSCLFYQLIELNIVRALKYRKF